jgi:DNA-binding NtrC family response regulator
MALFEPSEWAFAEKAADLVTTNPFHPSWMEKQRRILGRAARDPGEVYCWQPGWGLWGPRGAYPDVVRLGDRITELADRLRERLHRGVSAAPAELDRYETLALYQLYRTHGEEMDRSIDAAVRGRGPREGGARRENGSLPDVKPLWDDFRHEHAERFRVTGHDFPLNHRPEHVFACFFVLRRAYYHIFFNIIGTSKPVTRLRSAVWQSIVTHDLRRWSRSLHERMHDFPTLVTGPSGTGKELVAQAIGRSLYSPFDPVRKAFTLDFRDAFHAVNLAALPPQLIESELFGHVKGAFTFAVRDRQGRLDECPEHGAVFLDEVGELTGDLQVKLLRVLQTRRFQRVGANEDRAFAGKIIAATNRDLGAELQARRFREDFYYRLCADRITTPSLREQLDDRPEDLPVMVEFICRGVVGEERAAVLAGEVTGWIESHPQLRRGYAWPGNFRELEQCVRSYTLRKEYQPIQFPAGDPESVACATLAEAVLGERLGYDEIERRLFGLVHARTGSYQEAARLLRRNWRTVRARVKASEPPGESPQSGRRR